MCVYGVGFGNSLLLLEKRCNGAPSIITVLRLTNYETYIAFSLEVIYALRNKRRLTAPVYV